MGHPPKGSFIYNLSVCALQRTPLLRELSIAQNRIHTINLDAFRDLHSLKKLNLSDNRLESFNEFLLDELSVEILDLSNNNFMYADGKIHFRSSSLMVRESTGELPRDSIGCHFRSSTCATARSSVSTEC